MSTTFLQPTNVNFLHDLEGRMVIKRLPNVAFFLQEVQIPTVSISPATQNTPHDSVPRPGDALYRSQLQLSFKVNEDMDNYAELYDWMIGLAAPDDYDQYAALANVPREQRASGLGVVSDLTITLTNSARRVNREFRFQDCWPSSLGITPISTTSRSVGFVTAEASFKFRHFTLVDPSA